MRKPARDLRHAPVLLTELLRILPPRPGQTIADCTVGLGGHSAAILEHIRPTGLLFGIDFDPTNLALAREKLATVSDHFKLDHNNFAALPTILAEHGIEKVDAILADLGVGSPQIEDPAGGFS